MTFLPNALTVLRILMIPAFVAAYFAAPDAPNAALAIYLAAMITDALDGFLARALNCVSRFGTLVDPLADKLMTLSALMCLSWFGALSPVAPALVAAKDAFLVVGAYFVYKKSVVISAGLPGKLATFLLTLSISMLMLWRDNNTVTFIASCMVYVSIAASVFAVWYYVRIAKKRLNQSVETPDEEP